MDDAFDLGYLWGALKRRWLLIAAPAVLGAAMAVLVAMLLPPVYKSTARVIVESQQIPQELARSTVATAASERIRLIEERLKSRQNMLDLAQRYAVFAGRESLSPTDVVERMREATQFRTIGTASRRGARSDTTLTTFEVSFSAGRPAIAAQVANELLTQVLAENAQQRSERASETLNFFIQEVTRLERELQAVEARIAAIRAENPLSLPENLEFRRSELSNLQRDVFAAEARRLTLLDARRQIAAALEAGLEAVDRRLSPEEVELDRLRTQLAQQAAIYAPSHPLIRNLSARIAALETQTAAARPTPAAARGSAAPSQDGGEAGADANAGEPPAAAPELERIDAEIGLIDQQIARQQARMAELEAATTQSADVGIRLGALSRDYAALQAQYQQAVLKRAEAATGERLEISQQAERFEVIERPQPPEWPISPNRPLVAGAGAILSLGFGFALAALAELLNPAVRTPRDVERHLAQRPLAVIPYIATSGELARRRWTRRAAVFAVLVIAPSTLWVVDRQIMPLSVLAERAVERSGVGDTLTQMQQRFGR